MPVPNQDLNLSRQQDMQEQERREAASRQLKDAPPIEHDKPVMRFRLLAGAHIGVDLRAEPEPVYNPISGEPVINPKTKQPVMNRPSKQWVAGDIVEADHDLVEKCGQNKFMRLTDGPQKMTGQRKTIMRPEDHHRNDPADEVLERDPPKGPSGQVSTGYQEAAPAPQGEFAEDSPVRSGGLSDKGREVMREARDKAAEEQQQHVEQANRTSAEEGQQEQQNTPSHGGPGDEPQQQGKRNITLPANLNTMSVREMKEFAQRNEIDVKGANTRDEHLKAIRAAAKS